MAARVVSPRTREGKQEPATPLDEFAKRLAEQAKIPNVGIRRGAATIGESSPPLRHYNEALPGDPAGAVSPTFQRLEDKEKDHPKAIQSSSPERNGQLPRRSPHPRARGARHRRRRGPGRGDTDATRRFGWPKRPGSSWSRSIRGPFHRSARSWTSASSSTRPRRRRRPRASTSRPSCSRRSSSARRRTTHDFDFKVKHIRTLLRRREQVQARDRLPRPRDRAPGDRARRCSTRS